MEVCPRLVAGLRQRSQIGAALLPGPAARQSYHLYQMEV